MCVGIGLHHILTADMLMSQEFGIAFDVRTLHAVTWRRSLTLCIVPQASASACTHVRVCLVAVLGSCCRIAGTCAWAVYSRQRDNWTAGIKLPGSVPHQQAIGRHRHDYSYSAKVHDLTSYGEHKPAFLSNMHLHAERQDWKLNTSHLTSCVQVTIKYYSMPVVLSGSEKS